MVSSQPGAEITEDAITQMISKMQPETAPGKNHEVQITQESQQLNTSIEGVWSLRSDTMASPGGFIERDLSWGRRVLPCINANIIVDLRNTSPFIETRTSRTVSEITSVNEKGNKTELRFLWRGINVVTMFHFNENGTMWLEPPSDEGFRIFPGIDRNHVFHRVDGPEFHAEINTMQSTFQCRQPFARSVFLPHEFAVKNGAPFITKEDGTIEFGGNVFVYKIVDERDPFENEVYLTTHKKNNLLGVDILVQYYTGGTRSYTHLFNTATKQEISIPFDVNTHVDFWGFFAIDDRLIAVFAERVFAHDDSTGEILRDEFGSLFVLTSTEKAYAFDSATGELLWTQTFNLMRSGRGIIADFDDRLIFDDANGHRYRLFGDGRKVRFGDRLEF